MADIEPRTEEWLHTGDLGSVDAGGDVRFLGRKSDVVVTASGMNIHPADLESVVRAQPGVRDCMVVGWNGPRGPEPVAAVILDESGNGDQALQQILSGANHSLQEFQQIRSVFRWPAGEFPRNSTGKLLRREVAAWVQQQIQTKSANVALTSSQDPLLRLLHQVTGESAEGLDDTADLATALHLDSLARMQLAMGIEEQFGTSVSDEAIAQAKTLGDLRKLLRENNSAQSGNRALQISKANLGSPTDTTAAVIPGPNVVPSEAEGPAVPTSTENPGAPSFAAPSQRVGSDAPKYVHWPWIKPVQAVRVGFIEGILRPLVSTFAHPRVELNPQSLPQQPSIYVCNHVTAIDVALILFALPPRVRRHMAVAMSAELLAAWRRSRAIAAGVGAGPLRWLAPLQAQAVTGLMNVFPLPAGAGLRKSFAHVGEALDRGYNVLVFPEGRRTTDGELQPFQTGISLLAQESQTAVVPMALTGLWQASQQHGRYRVRPEGLAVVVGTPLRRATDESHAQFAARLHSEVQHLIDNGRDIEQR